MTRRAIAREDKQARRAAILHAARALFIAGKGGLPTAAEIASATGLAKGTVYLYFATKEEIFAALLLEGWVPVMETIGDIFGGSRGEREGKIQAFITSFVGHLNRRPELLRLDALGSGVLEKNMTAEALYGFKRDFTSYLVRAGESIDSALDLPAGRGVQLLMRSYALTRGLWQTAQHEETAPQEAIAPVLLLTPKLFARELTEALEEYWRGALESPPPVWQTSNDV